MGGVSQIEIRKSYILIHVKGESFRPLDITLTIQKVRRAVQEHKLHRILVVRSHPVRMLSSLFYLTKLAEYLGGQDVKSARVALVFPPVMHTQELKMFVDAVQNIGMEMDLFGEVREAEKWLKESKHHSELYPKRLSG